MRQGAENPLIIGWLPLLSVQSCTSKSQTCYTMLYLLYVLGNRPEAAFLRTKVLELETQTPSFSKFNDSPKNLSEQHLVPSFCNQRERTPPQWQLGPPRPKPRPCAQVFPLPISPTSLPRSPPSQRSGRRPGPLGLDRVFASTDIGAAGWRRFRCRELHGVWLRGFVLALESGPSKQGVQQNKR